MQKKRFSTILAISLAMTGAGISPALSAENPASEAAPHVPAYSLAGAFLAAKTAQLQGDLDVATRYYEQALQFDPTSSLLQQEAMFAFFADGRFEDGIEIARLVRDTPEAGKVARIALGIDALRRGRFEAALEEFDLNETSDLDALLLDHLSAWAEAGLGRVDRALERLSALDDAPWYPVFNDYQAGLIAILAGETEKARDFLGAVIDDPANAQTSPDAYLSAVEALARLEAREGDSKAALAALDKGLDLAEDYAPLTRLKQRIEQGETIEPAISNVSEGAAESLYILGQAINRGNGQQVALLYFQFARAAAPDKPELLTALANIAERTDQLDLAISYYGQVPEHSALRPTAELQMGLDLWYADRKDESKTALRRFIEQYPDDLRGYLALADVLAADENYKEAAEILDEATEIAEPGDTSNWNLYYQRGIAYERLGQWEKAEPNFQKALALSPDQPQVLNYLGYSWVNMNTNLQEGLEMIKTAVELRPNDGYIIDSLGWAYYRLGRFDEAVEQLERAVLLTPVDPTINDHLGDAYWRVGREREARFQWKRALTGTPELEPEDIARIQEKLEEGLPPLDEMETIASEDGGPSVTVDPAEDDKAGATDGEDAPDETGAEQPAIN